MLAEQHGNRGLRLYPFGGGLDRVFVTYEAPTTPGKRFGNTEILRVRNGKITEAEVYFGWDVPHKAAAGGFVGRD
jgi:hypothetical protein